MIKEKSKAVVNYTIIILSCIVLLACKSKRETDLDREKEPIVSVNGKTLYKSDLDNAISEALNAADSTKSADAYIRMWINDELIYEKAKQNIEDQDRINELVENYRQSLTVFTYLEQLLKEELSKKISENELKEYYDKNQNRFKLESNLVKGLFIKVPRSSRELTNLKQWYKSNTEAAKENIEKASIQNTVIYDYFYDRWISIDDVVSNIPVPIGDANQFVRSNKNFEAQDSSYVYLLHIEEYALAGSVAPYVYAKPQVTEVLINRYRETFLKQFEEDLYKKAIADEGVKFHIDRTPEAK
ncbi:MAG: hypothetical protein RL662_1303 [Bacteroidota bacterium]|jgi:hypothetical protein